MVLNRCENCSADYACPEFRTKAQLVQFNALIPPSMLLAPLPIELWPNMCRGALSDLSSQPNESACNETTDSPVRRFVATLGLPLKAELPP